MFHIATLFVPLPTSNMWILWNSNREVQLLTADPLGGTFLLFPIFCNEPIVKNYIGKPDFIARYPQHINSTKLLWVPLEQLVVPFVIKPDIGRQNLVLLILPKMLINWEI